MKKHLLLFVVVAGLLSFNCHNKTGKGTATAVDKMDTGKKLNAELPETYWKLTELMGKPVAPPAEGVREIHIILKKQDNRFRGFAGCNNIMGSYELKDGNYINFKEIAGTKMACPDMSLENQLMEVLGRVDNYSILEDRLSLNKARMAPLARFEAVYH